MGWGDSTDPTPPRSDGRMPANCTVLPCACVPIKTISIQSLEFVGDHGMLTDYRKDFKTSGDKFSKPEFDLARKHTHPVSYSMGQNIEVYLTFQVEPANACPEVGAIFGQGPQGIFFDYTNHTFTPGTNKVFMIAKKSLARKVQILDFEVLWQTKGISAQFDFFGDFTKNTIYVTYDTPYNDTPYNNRVTEKRLSWACTLCSGDSNGHDSVKKIHDSTGSYDLSASTPSPLWTIAGGAHAQCMDLSKFYMLATELLGLRTGAVVYLYPKVGKTTKKSSNSYDAEKRLVAPPHPAATPHKWINPNEETLLVDHSGGWNAFEACYEFTHPDTDGVLKTRYYAGGAKIYDTPEEVMKAVCKETHWIFEGSPGAWSICATPGPSPVDQWSP